MSYRYYEDSPSRSPKPAADPSIDAWFRELRGDAGGEGRPSTALARRGQPELDSEVEAWFRGDSPDGPQSWSVDTRAWSPEWDSGAAPNGNGTRSGRPGDRNGTRAHKTVRMDRRTTGE